MSSPTATHPVIEQMLPRIQMAASLFAIDIQNMSDEMLSQSPGGKARCGFDLIYEVADVNFVVARGASGEKGVTEAQSGWTIAPDTYRTKDAALAHFQASVDGVTKALAECPVERFDEEIETPFGPTPLLRMAHIVPSHIMYHSGQLNYIQTIYGDDEFHWG